MLQVSSDAKCYALSVPCYKNRGNIKAYQQKPFTDFCSILARHQFGGPARLRRGLPTMFVAGMNVLKAIRLRGGCAAAVALASQFNGLYENLSSG
jgi:hypothetical protein